VNVSASTALVVAIAGLAVGVVSLALAWWGMVRVRRVRDAQRLMLGGGQGRDYARIYMKELDRGRASVDLSPEEAEAVERAMSR